MYETTQAEINLGVYNIRIRSTRYSFQIDKKIVAKTDNRLEQSLELQ